MDAAGEPGGADGITALKHGLPTGTLPSGGQSMCPSGGDATSSIQVHLWPTQQPCCVRTLHGSPPQVNDGASGWAGDASGTGTRGGWCDGVPHATTARTSTTALTRPLLDDARAGQVGAVGRAEAALERAGDGGEERGHESGEREADRCRDLIVARIR